MIRILIAAEQAVIREGLKQILGTNRDMAVTGEAGSAQELLNEISKNHYDVATLDIAIPGRNWLDILKDLRSQKPNLSILILSTRANEDDAKRAFRAGASGYLTTDCAPDELLTAVGKVSSGGKYVSASLGERLALDLEKGSEKLPQELLSDREYQVMCLLASGKTATEIADEMSLSVKTVSTYRSRVLEKLNLKNNVELARYYTKFIDTKTVQCKKCRQDNPQMAKFCAYCGFALDVAVEPALPVLGTPLETTEGHNRQVRWAEYKWFIGVSAIAVAILVAGIIVSRNQPTVIPNAAPAVVSTGAEPKNAGGVVLPTVPIEETPKNDSGTVVPTAPTVPLISPVSTLPVEVELKYDDGTDDAMLSSGGGGYLTSFSPPSVPFTVKKVRVFGMRHPSQMTEFVIQIWDNEQNIIYSATYPITVFFLMTECPHVWVDVDVPDIDVKSNFYIHLYAGTFKENGIALAADNSVLNRRSDLTTRGTVGSNVILNVWPYPQGNWWADKDKVNWMIRVVGQGSQ